jgi:hypothetical protein
MKTASTMSAESYYQEQLRHALTKVNWLRQGFPESPLAFLCHPIRDHDPVQQRVNLLKMSETIAWHNRETDLVVFNQLPFNAIFCPDDPQQFDLKTEIFYRPLIAMCHLVLVAPGYERSSGCMKELEFSRLAGKSIYFLRELEAVGGLGVSDSLEGIDFAGKEYFTKVPVEQRSAWHSLCF